MKKKTRNIVIGIFLIVLLTVAIFLISNKTKQMPQNVNELAYSEYKTTIGGKEYGISTNVIQASSEVKPNISAGMIPIKFDGNYWVIVAEDNWYDYSKGEPAYIMLNDGMYQSKLIKDMTDKKLASETIGDDGVGAQIRPTELGSVYVWIPRYAYNENNEIIYIKQECTVAGTWNVPSIFTYEIDNRNLSLAGIWVEYNSYENTKLVDTKVTELSKGEDDTIYGLIGNTIATNANNEKDNVTDIAKKIGENIINDSSNTNRTILKIVDTNKREPLEGKAYYDATEEKIKIEVTYNTNEIDKIIDVVKEKELNIESTSPVTAYAEVNPENDTEWKYLIIDKIGNQKIVEEKNLFFIYNRDTLVAFREAVNNGETTEEAKAYQIANVELNVNAELNERKYTKDEETGECTFNEDAEQWIPIGNADGVEFKGKYYGKGHTISGLYINNTNSSNQCMGLFGRVNGGEIYDLGIIDSTITSNSQYASALIAKATNDVIVENCYNAGTISETTNCVGGICGNCARSTIITNCYNTGKISGYSDVVGIASSGTITNCYNAGSLSAIAGSAFGIGGYTTTNCYNTGKISGIKNVSGIGGYTVSNCYNTGEITGRENIAGISYGTSIKNCYNTGEITGTKYVSGINSNWTCQIIKNCYNAGKISGANYVAGISSYSNSYFHSILTISQCYNIGEISGTGDYVGGIIAMLSNSCESGHTYGTYSARVQYCYNAGKISGSSYVGGICGYSENSNTSVNTNSGYNAYMYIQDCYNTGIISGTTNCIGGICGSVNNKSSAIIGTTETNITYCFNAGEISGAGYVGGICGEARSAHSNSTATKTTYITKNNLYIYNCYNLGKIGRAGYVGGICGTATASNGNTGSTKQGRNGVYTYINHCYNTTKEITGSTKGAICGRTITGSAKAGQAVSTSNSSDLSGTELDKDKMLETLGTAYRENTELSTQYPVLSWQTDNDKLNLINSDNAFVEDTEGINGGYPILSWQVK